MQCHVSSNRIENMNCPRKRSNVRRFAAFVVAAALSLGLIHSPGWAQGTKEKKAKDFESSEKTVSTGDNFDLKLTYYSSAQGKEAPVVILLHGKSGQRRQWDGFAKQLQKEGEFAVIAADLRGHGESAIPKRTDLKKSDYEAMVIQDMQAIKDLIFEEHQLGRLNMNKLGIVACDFSAGVAMAAVQIDWSKEPHDDDPDPKNCTPRGQDYYGVALVSPDLTTPGLVQTKVASSLKPISDISFLICCSEKIAPDANAAKKLSEHLSSKKDREDRVVVRKYPESLKGMDLVLRDNQIKKDIYSFLVKNVKGHASSWKDRRSKLERE